MKRIALLVLLLAACATAGTGGTTRGRDLITAEEIAESGVSDAYSLVQTRRPQWLRVRGSKDPQTVAVNTGGELASVGLSGGNVNVYFNNALMGQAEALRQVPLAGVRYLRFFSPAAANLRWGSGNVNGAILVSTEEFVP